MKTLLNRRTPLHDGITLASDTWLPDGKGPWPTIVIRTPYHRAGGAAEAMRFTQEGYACVLQDVRGKYDSDGDFAPVEQETSDGQDTLDWVANQSWCSGRIGTYGRSYPGMVQLPAAAGGHEALKCIMPGVAPMDYFSDWVRYDGCFALANMLRWPFEHATLRTKPNLSHFSWPDIWRAAGTDSVETLEDRLGAPLRLMRKWLEKDQLDEYWRSLDQTALFPQIACSGLHQAGFFDHISRGAYRAFNEIQDVGASELARTSQRLIVGPWGHAFPDTPGYGDWTFSIDSRIDFHAYALRYLNLWLKDIDDGMTEEPAVRYYLMGENRWEGSNEWPPAGTEYASWYLESTGNAIGVGSDGSLSVVASVGADVDTYVYDPADPAPTHGGQVYWGMADMVRVGPVDQRTILTRSDVLLYKSKPLPRSLTVVGDITLKLWISTTAEDTDFVAKFCVVDNMGGIDTLTIGSLRCRYRDSKSDPTPIPRGGAVEITIHLSQIAYTFPAESRIALMVTSSCFPRILPHPNRFEPTAFGVPGLKAIQSVHHSSEYPSRLILPIQP